MANIDLDPHLEAFVRQQIDAGRYQDIGEVVREGLRLLEEREATLNEIRRELEEALDEPGADIPAEEVFARLERRGSDRKKMP